MNHKVLMAFTCIFSSSVWADTWLQVGEDGYMVECPDAIEFKASTYLIFNDCYGSDPREPIIEVGTYEIIQDQISLFQRHQTYESVLSGSLKNRSFKIQKNEKLMKFVDGENEFHFRKLSESE